MKSHLTQILDFRITLKSLKVYIYKTYVTTK
jgi:hypothetical protein